MPNWETRIGWFTIPNPFWGGVLLPGVTFGLLYGWPWLEAWRTKDHREHHVLDRPRDKPMRTALGVATLTFYTILGLAAADDVLAVALGLSMNAILNAYRVMLLVLPPIAGFLAYRLCKELQKRDGQTLTGEHEALDGADDVIDADVTV
jgi:ubiquinol-cytochrome c reductase cytochrome b subunit